MFQNITHLSNILSPGYIDYFEVPVTKNKSLHYKVDDDIFLIHTIFYSYYPDLSERKLPVRCFSLRKTNLEINKVKHS